MRSSRGMGIISPKKVPRTITRKDDPNKVKLYKKGGGVLAFKRGGKAKA